jgi:DDE family transposase
MGQRPRCPATRAQAGPWSRSRRVGSTGAGSAPGVPPRWVGTAMAPARPTGRSPPMDWARGHADNERTAHQRALPSARPSWHRFAATPLRLCMPAAASGCREPWRRAGCQTAPGACAPMATLQLHGRTRGARVPAVTDRLTIAFPASCPVAPLWRRRVTVCAGGRLLAQGRCVRWRAPAAQGPRGGGRPKRAETIAWRPIASLRPMGPGAGPADNLVWGACRAWDTGGLRRRWAPAILSPINF